MDTRGPLELPFPEGPMAERQEFSTRWLEFVSGCAVLSCAWLLVSLGYRLVQLGALSHAPIFFLAVAPIAYLAADLASGLVHWMCDTFFEEDSPLIGRLLIAPFREHHRDPMAIVRHGFLELNGNNCLALLPLLLFFRRQQNGSEPASVLADGFLFFFSLAVLATNQFHQWAHAASVPRAVRWLQDYRLILAPARHAIHHREYRSAYCITTGWMNSLLDRLSCFPHLEEALASLGVPRAKT